MSRQTFYEDDNYKLLYQIGVAGDTREFHVHCLVYDWKLSVLKDLYRKWAKLIEKAKSLGYETVYSISPNPKFCKLFGAESIGAYREHEVMKWDLKH